MDPQLAPGGSIGPRGSLTMRKIGAPPPRPAVRTRADALQYGMPRLSQPRAVREWKDANREHFDRSLEDMGRYERGHIRAVGQLFGRVVRLDGATEDLGLMSCRVVTDAAVAFIVDAFQGLVEPELMRYHALGTGTTAEAATQTALTTELTTQYATANTRPTGTLGEQAGAANTYETTATVTVSAAVGVTEHGIFTQASVPGGVLLDRSVFAVVNLGASEALQLTYRLSFPSGG